MRSLSGASLTVAAMLALVSVAATGCSKYGELKARQSFKAANQAYARQDYKKAAVAYEETLAADPNNLYAYFFLANSYDNQFKPELGNTDPENNAVLDKAITNYQLGYDKITASGKPEEAIYAKRSLEYLALAYGPDKLNDPTKAEPVVQNLIKIDPKDPAYYFQLSKLYEDAGAYAEAEQALLWAKEAKPTDPQVYSTLATYYNRQTDYDKLFKALEDGAANEPTNPERFYTLATYRWDNAQRNFRLTDEEKMENVTKGLEAVNKALSLRAEYLEAMTYKGLLLRTQANLEKNPAKQQALLKQATALSDQAEELRKRKATGTGG
jgi:predicted Zn-dependent protease